MEATARDAGAAEHATLEAAVEFTDIAHDLPKVPEGDDKDDKEG